MRRRLKVDSDVDEVTLDGRLFHTREATTRNARSPMVEWRVGGTTSVDVDADLRRRRESKYVIFVSLVVVCGVGAEDGCRRETEDDCFVEIIMSGKMDKKLVRGRHGK